MHLRLCTLYILDNPIRVQLRLTVISQHRWELHQPVLSCSNSRTPGITSVYLRGRGRCNDG